MLDNDVGSPTSLPESWRATGARVQAAHDSARSIAIEAENLDGLVSANVEAIDGLATGLEALVAQLPEQLDQRVAMRALLWQIRHWAADVANEVNLFAESVALAEGA